MFNEFLIDLLKISRAEFITSDSLKLSESDLLHFRSIVKRLQSNEPFQYVLGTTEFYGLELDCDARALIPRPETEELVDWIAKDSTTVTSILDLCTGSGCIALALKSVYPNCRISGVDVSDEALNLAKQNARKVGLAVVFERHDILVEPHYKEELKWDIIVSNPPYIPISDKSEMHQNVLDFEPELALFVPNDEALLFYRYIAEFGQRNLAPNGKLYFEVHEKYAKEVQALMISLNYSNVEIRLDLQGKERMVCGQY